MQLRASASLFLRTCLVAAAVTVSTTTPLNAQCGVPPRPGMAPKATGGQTTPIGGNPTSSGIGTLGGSGGLIPRISNGLGFKGKTSYPGVGSWVALPDMPKSLGEVTVGAMNGKLYVVGEGSGSTVTYDLGAGTWSSSQASSRPHEGNHHASEVHDGKWYIIGGFDNGAEGKVQIYDPDTNSWSLGADMPWVGGSVNTALISGRIYVCGGVEDDLFTTDNCAVYDPDADSWNMLAPMIDGRNHAAAGTDGRRLYVFGGRGPGSGDTNMVANGFADVQVYDPATNTWDSSNLPGSQLRPLPIGRGGTGKAVYHDKEFYVFGGETLTGPGAVSGNVYNRVDIFCPGRNKWRRGADIPTARHGIYPIEVRGSVYLLGGGKVAGGSKSRVSELYILP